MLFTPAPRDMLLRMLPKGGVVAEIGVFEGEFSRAIIDNAEPTCLHLIDPWMFQGDSDKMNHPDQFSSEDVEARYRKVVESFKNESEEGRVVLHREKSLNAIKGFQDEFFDWVYIDGLHDREEVLADLIAYAKKTKSDGLILGHDYTNHFKAKELNFGVIEAVNEFVVDYGFEFLVLTNEIYPTFVLAKDSTSQIATNLTSNILLNVRGTVEIRDFPERDFIHKEVVTADGLVNLVASF